MKGARFDDEMLRRRIRFLSWLPGGRQLAHALEEGDFEGVDRAARHTFFQVFGVLSSLFLASEAGLFWQDGRIELAVLLGGYAVIAAAGTVLLVRLRADRWFGRLSVFAAFVLFSTSFVGILYFRDANYLVWALTFIPVAFYFVGLREGLFWLGLFAVTIVGSHRAYVQLGGDPLPATAVRESAFAFVVIAVFFAVFELIRELYAAKVYLQNQQLQRRAAEDFLTGLPNRRTLQHELELRLADTDRTGAPFVLALADLDRFKQVNDRYGHAAGDDVLRDFAQVVRTTLRARDSFGRWGGEEFLLILPDTTLQEAHRVLERVRMAVSERTRLPEPVTVSIGYTEWSRGDGADAMLRRADAAMYRAKEQGRDRGVAETPPISDDLETEEHRR